MLSEQSKKFLIQISQDGRFAITFDTTTLRIKIYRNTDYRPFTNKKDEKMIISQNDANNKIDEIIADLEISKDLTTIDDYNPQKDDNNYQNNSYEYGRWLIDISSLQKFHGSEYYIFVAVSCIDIKEKGGENKKKSFEIMPRSIELSAVQMDTMDTNVEHVELKKKTIICCLQLKKSEVQRYSLINTRYYYNYITGIPRFIEDIDLDPKSDDIYNDYILKRFILLNSDGIFSTPLLSISEKKDTGVELIRRIFGFEYSLNERFDYPKGIQFEYIKEDCISRLLACLYNKYLLVEKYKNKVQALEVYDLTEMKLVTAANIVKNKDKHIKKCNKNIFTISKNKLKLCFTRGLHSIKLYFIENGLQIVTKKFDAIKTIHLLEFIHNDEKLLIIGDGITGDQNPQQMLIIWDLYNTGKVSDPIPLYDFNSYYSATRTSGNLLKVDDDGNVTSILKEVDPHLAVKEVNETNETTIIESKLDEKYTLENKQIVDNKEPWVKDKYKIYSICLYNNEKETLELIVGRSSVQIWHQIHSKSEKKDDLPNRGEPFLEYIWTTGVPIDQENEETRLHIKEIKYKFGYKHLYLKVYWKEPCKEKPKERIIRWQDISEKINAVRDACKALEHLNKRVKFLVTFDERHCYDEMVMYINHIIWRFIDQYPDEYRLLDFRHNVMKNLILGDSDHLIKFILFGNEDDDKEKFVVKHIPRSKMWRNERNFAQADDLDPFEIKGKNFKRREEDMPTNDLELAIYHCKGRELKDTMIVAYLLEYYTNHAKEYAGWMNTVSKALPFLYKYHYDDYAKKLFNKECFADQDHFSAQDPYEIIPEEIQSCHKHNNTFIAFRPKDRLQSDEVSKFKQWWNYVTIYNFKNKLLTDDFKKKAKKLFEFFDKDHEYPPIALRVVPLPEFTMHKIPKKYAEYGFWMDLPMNLFLFIFIPRWYQIGKSDTDLSPFARVIRYENNDDMYDNPATEAAIDFRWRRARAVFMLLALRFIIFAFCFGVVSWAYLVHESTGELHIFLVYSIILFYYLAVYLMITEIIQFFHHGFRKYACSIFNFFDILAIIVPTLVMSYMLTDFQFSSDGFGSVEKVKTELIVGISFSTFVLWIEFILYLRLFSYIATYIYYVMIIVKTVFPFIIFSMLVMIAFAHTMFVLLKNPDIIDIKDDTFSGSAVNNITNENLVIELKSDFDPRNSNDNPFSEFITSIEAAYFWTAGNWVQRDKFNFWAIDLLSIIASLLFVTILQNMLIAFMGGVYEKAATKGRQALLRFRAGQIADYEALRHFYFGPPEPDAKYIYYIGRSKNFEEWCKSSKREQCEIYKDFEKKSTHIRYNFTKFDYDEVSIWNDDFR